MREEVKVAIVGAGPAGCAAAMFLKRAEVDPLLLDERLPGGLLREANLVENYPGFPEGLSGNDLAELISTQLTRLNVRFERARVDSITAEGAGFVVRTDDVEYGARAVVLATGTAPRRLDLPGARELEGRRLFYGLASPDVLGAHDREVVVLGGGDAAFDYGLNMRGRGNSVRILMRSIPTCLPLLVERAKAQGIDIVEGCQPDGIRESGDEIVLSCPERGEVSCSMVIVAHGREPRLETLSPELGRSAGLSFDRIPETNVKGLYVAGDVVRGLHRQTAIAVGDGVLAAMKTIECLERGGVRA